MAESVGECSSGICVVGPSVGKMVSVTHTTRNLFFRNFSDSVTVTVGTAVMFSAKSEAEYAVKSLDALVEGNVVVVGSG